ncbi:type II secretion system minor pseudopilin GspK [Vibrio sp. S4M6]|uniref:type II secretion system minor pseudopilin GspK n=1 Tax=Vibrio sinus TaxID=2946865 RepID=UPI00202A1178|nr:type II secretion system minor pseudopilin GspK [Vibrio sinus]MCL9780317.1 type II secretion system minor pseudopilin GspK [Vibrio sinus]
MIPKPSLATKNRMRRRRQRGVALIIILMLVAIMAAIAASMSERLFTQFKRSGNQINHQQAYWYAIGVEALAEKAIEESYKQSENDSNKTVNLSQPWAYGGKEMSLDLDYGKMKGKIVDKQACFNINALSGVAPTSNSPNGPYLVRFFQNLLESVGVESYKAEVIANSTWSYVSANQAVRAMTGISDSHYESLKPSYLPPNGMMADSSELRAVNEMTGKIMLEIQPFICALPTTEWKMNVNTLKPNQANLLAALFYPNLSVSNAKQIIADRPEKGWETVSAFMSSSSVLTGLSDTARSDAEKYLTVDSAYFGLDAQIFVGDSRVRIRSLLFSKDRKTATVIRRRFGGISERVLDRSSE